MVSWGVARDVDLPDWLDVIAGEAPALLVAPHGGRRPRRSELDGGEARKVNDLHTAELTAELAARARCAAIVNRGEDRNRLDLNRVSHVRQRAPWLLGLVLGAVREQIERVGEATILFVHGWNAIQPSADIGIGARLDGGRLVPVRQGLPTVTPSFLPRLVRFAEECRCHGIDVTFGDRYPAAGRDNMLQIFTARFADDADPRIRELARLGAEGKISATQLELAVPLRWPGELRSRILSVTARLLRRPEQPEEPAALDGFEIGGEGGPLRERLALEFHDGRAGVGGFAGIERLASGRRHGRLLLCIGAARLALFTGEDARRRATPLHCAGLVWTRAESGAVTLEYEGPCLAFPRTDPFLDLEAGLADADLSTMEARLEWRPIVAAPAGATGGAGSRLGRIEGRIRHAGSTTSISAPATLQEGSANEASGWRERRVVRAPLGSGVFLSICSRLEAGETIDGEIARDGALEPLLSGRVTVRKGADGLTPEGWRIEALSRSGPLRVFGHVTHAVPVVRPARDGRVLTFFGLARFGGGDQMGFGTFELSERLASGASVREQKGTPQ